MKLKSDLVEEIKESRAYAAKIQVALNNAAEAESKFGDKKREAGYGGSVEIQREISRPAKKDMTPGLLFSNSPPAELSSEDTKGNYYGHSATGAQVWQGWGEQPRMHGLQDTMGPYSGVGQFETHSGHTGIIGQPGNSRYPQSNYNPYAGSIEQRVRENSFRMQNMVKLPKLELKRFNGDPMKWLEYRESFQRNIHDNTGYSGVHKMSYLKACLDDPASTTIANLSIIGDNYRPAVETLKGKYGQSGLLEEAHMAALKATQGVSNVRDVNKLKRFYDDVDSHFKALLILGVPG